MGYLSSMKYILAGTNRPQSRTKQIALLIQKLYKNQGEEVEIIDLAELAINELTGSHYGANLPAGPVKQAIDKITHSQGLIVVCPEYNGSMPGALKYFIDFWKYPETFEYRPVCFVGLGGKFGGLRPVEHLQQVFGYRNAYVFPMRVFIQDVFNQLKDESLKDPMLNKLLVDQVVGFQKFVIALQSQNLDANSVNKIRPTN